MNDARRAGFSAISANKKKTAAADDGIMHVLPGSARVSGRRLLELFEEMAATSAATVGHIGGLNELPDAARRYLSDSRRAGARRLHLNHPSLVSLDWQPLGALPELDVSASAAFFDAEIGITRAFCAIAETGSIVLLSKAGVSSAAYFLPGVDRCAAERSDRCGAGRRLDKIASGVSPVAAHGDTGYRGPRAPAI